MSSLPTLLVSQTCNLTFPTFTLAKNLTPSTKQKQPKKSLRGLSHWNLRHPNTTKNHIKCSWASTSRSRIELLSRHKKELDEHAAQRFIFNQECEACLKQHLSHSKTKALLHIASQNTDSPIEVKVRAPICICGILWIFNIKGVVDMEHIMSNGPRSQLKWRHSMTCAHKVHCVAYPKHVVTYLNECRLPTQWKAMNLLISHFNEPYIYEHWRQTWHATCENAFSQSWGARQHHGRYSLCTLSHAKVGASWPRWIAQKDARWPLTTSLQSGLLPYLIMLCYIVPSVLC